MNPQSALSGFSRHDFYVLPILTVFIPPVVHRVFEKICIMKMFELIRGNLLTSEIQLLPSLCQALPTWMDSCGRSDKASSHGSAIQLSPTINCNSTAIYELPHGHLPLETDSDKYSESITLIRPFGNTCKQLKLKTNPFSTWTSGTRRKDLLVILQRAGQGNTHRPVHYRASQQLFFWRHSQVPQAWLPGQFFRAVLAASLVPPTSWAPLMKHCH